jgi:hypothetical protein
VLLLTTRNGSNPTNPTERAIVPPPIEKASVLARFDGRGAEVHRAQSTESDRLTPAKKVSTPRPAGGENPAEQRSIKPDSNRAFELAKRDAPRLDAVPKAPHDSSRTESRSRLETPKVATRLKPPADPFTPKLRAQKPIKVKESLEKILAAPREWHANQVVVPAGMYVVIRARDDGGDRPSRYRVEERKYESRKTSGEPFLTKGPTLDVEFERGLARQLDQLKPDRLDEKPAILTMEIAASGDRRIVSVAILQNSYPRLRKGVTPDIVYETMEVSSGSSNSIAEASDDDWEQGRMLKFAKHCKAILNARKLQWQSMQMGAAQIQMNMIWMNSMREATIPTAQEEAVQQGRVRGFR